MSTTLIILISLLVFVISLIAIAAPYTEHVEEIILVEGSDGMIRRIEDERVRQATENRMIVYYPVTGISELIESVDDIRFYACRDGGVMNMIECHTDHEIEVITDQLLSAWLGDEDAFFTILDYNGECQV